MSRFLSYVDVCVTFDVKSVSRCLISVFGSRRAVVEGHALLVAHMSAVSICVYRSL
jgi:hypothetical protein